MLARCWHRASTGFFRQAVRFLVFVRVLVLQEVDDVDAARPVLRFVAVNQSSRGEFAQPRLDVYRIAREHVHLDLLRFVREDAASIRERPESGK